MRYSIFWFIIFTLGSPWFLLLMHNRQLPIAYSSSPPVYQFPLDDVNTYRGEAIERGLGLPAKIGVNKYEAIVKIHLYKYLDTINPHQLFFESDETPLGAPFSGPMFLSLLPLIVYGCFFAAKKQQSLLVALMLAPLPAALIDNQYSYIARVALFLVLSSIASYGATKMRKSHRMFFSFILLFFLFELLKFNHNLDMHYTLELAKRVFG